MKRILLAILAMFCLTAQAAVIGRGNGLVYDDVLNITWLSDFGQAQASGADADGLMTWAEANAWAAALNTGGQSGWRLPHAFDGSNICDTVVGCQDTELAHLFNVTMGVVPFADFTMAADQQALSLFGGIQQYWYWMGDELAGDPDQAWRYDTRYGFQEAYFKEHYLFATAVHDGDVAGMGSTGAPPAEAPEPNPLGLLLFALAVLWMHRRAAR